jgi:hypothetical protein
MTNIPSAPAQSMTTTGDTPIELPHTFAELPHDVSSVLTDGVVVLTAHPRRPPWSARGIELEKIALARAEYEAKHGDQPLPLEEDGDVLSKSFETAGVGVFVYASTEVRSILLTAPRDDPEGPELTVAEARSLAALLNRAASTLEALRPRSASA